MTPLAARVERNNNALRLFLSKERAATSSRGLSVIFFPNIIKSALCTQHAAAAATAGDNASSKEQTGSGAATPPGFSDKKKCE